LGVKVYRQLKFFIIAIGFSLLLGCQNAPVQPEDVFKRSLSAIVGEDHYGYSGHTSSQVNGVKLENMVEFEGFVKDHERVFMNLALQPPNGESENYTLYSDNEQLYIQRQNQWSQLNGGEEAFLAQHFRHWNPVDNLRELISLNKTVSFSKNQDEGKSDEVIIRIQPEDMKKVIAKELEDQFESSMGTMSDLEKLRESLKLSDSEFAEMKRQVDESVKQSRKELGRLINSLQVQAVYSLKIHSDTHRPKQLKMNVQSKYESTNGPVDENTLVTYQFKDFGKEVKIDLPGS
jgi:DNA-binding transcriptional regulator YiaG